MKDQFKLDVNGFEFIEDAQSSTPELLEALRGNDKATIEKLYYPQVERIVKQMANATRIFTFDHTVRRRVSAAGEKGPDGKERIAPVLNGQEQPAKLVHCDQSTDGAIRRVHMHMEAEAPELLKKRRQIINIWRPLCGPVEDWRLGMMDVQTLQVSDILPTYLWKNQYEFTGSTMRVSHQESQSWYYLDHQRTDELTFIKI